MAWEIAIALNLYRGYDLTTALNSVKRCGAEYVDLDFLGPLPFREETLMSHLSLQDLDEPFKIQELLETNRLKTVTFSGHMDLSKPENISLFLRKMEFAKVLGIKYIAAFAGLKTRAHSFLNNMIHIVEKAEELELVVTLETETPGDLLPSGEEARMVLQHIGSDRIKFLYDFGNVYFANKGEIDLVEDFAKALDVIGVVHLKDPVVYSPFLMYTGIGQGTFNYATIFDQIRNSGKHFPIVLEIPYFLRSKNWEPFEVLNLRKSLHEIEDIAQQSLEFVKRHLLE
nr:sugar phosphate isomerase/epimerase family protein [Candidatus Calescibacterium sp.]